MAESDLDEPVRVLLIEDDPDILEMYRMKLERDGYNVSVARDGEQGLALALQSIPDIIFLDIRLPKKDGLEVLAGIRADAATVNTPVVILSNYGEQELIDRGLKLGALEVLLKAKTSPSSLSQGINEWLKE